MKYATKKANKSTINPAKIAYLYLVIPMLPKYKVIMNIVVSVLPCRILILIEISESTPVLSYVCNNTARLLLDEIGLNIACSNIFGSYGNSRMPTKSDKNIDPINNLVANVIATKYGTISNTVRTPFLNPTTKSSSPPFPALILNKTVTNINKGKIYNSIIKPLKFAHFYTYI